MNKVISFLIFCSFSSTVFSQTSYTGFIDKYPVELVTNLSSDGVARAMYVYTNYDDPIEINGTLKQKNLVLFENDKTGKNKASLSFSNFDAKANTLEGTWKDLVTGKQLPIRLNKQFDIEDGDEVEWKEKELLQPVALKDKYFKLVVTKNKGNFAARVSGIKILEKKTDKLIQQLQADCQLWGLNSVSVDDYNFDGIPDFSVFEGSYAGPNTSSLYFLYDPVVKKYFESDISGTSLEFDSKTKRIYERNQCCAGASIINTEYKLVNNKMVLVKQTCLKYDEKTGDYKKVKCD